MNISIIVLTYNHSKYVIDCLNSVKYQAINYNFENHHTIQLIVSDDSSKDETVDIVHEWKKSNLNYFEDFIVIENERNIGTCLNYVNALKKCNGDYIKVIGGDDMFPEASIFDIFRYLNHYDMVFGVPFVYYENSYNNNEKILRYLNKVHCIQMEENKVDYYDMIHRYCFLNAPATYVSKKLLIDKRVMDFLGSYKYTDDYPQWLKMAEIKNIKYTSIPIISVIYRRTNGSAYIIRNRDLLEERKRSYRYALGTCQEFLGKLLLRNELMILGRQGGKLSGLLNLKSYICELYWFKNKTKNKPFTIELVDYTLKYIENIKQEKFD